QIEVADVGPIIARPRQADLGIEIGAVEINLTAMRMNDAANGTNGCLEYPAGGWVGDHGGGEPVTELGGLLPQVREVHVAVPVAFDRDDLHSRHVRRSRIGPVRRSGNETDRALRFPTRPMKGADR